MPAGLDFYMAPLDEKPNAPEINGHARMRTPVHPGCAALRRAVRRNIASFPSQTPAFLKQPVADVQWRVVVLFFVRGWRATDIAARFHVPKHRIWKVLNEWSVRALALGYVQVIDEEAFATCCRMDVEGRKDRDSGETLPGGRPVDVPQEDIDLIAALDIAIAHCEEWREVFWMRAATLLRDMRTAAAVALEVRRSTGQVDGRLVARQSVASHAQYGLGVREEAQVSHAVV